MLSYMHIAEKMAESPGVQTKANLHWRPSEDQCISWITRWQGSCEEELTDTFTRLDFFWSFTAWKLIDTPCVANIYKFQQLLVLFSLRSLFRKGMLSRTVGRWNGIARIKLSFIAPLTLRKNYIEERDIFLDVGVCYVTKSRKILEASLVTYISTTPARGCYVHWRGIKWSLPLSYS